MNDAVARALAHGDEVTVADAWWGGRRLGPSVFGVDDGAVVGPPRPAPPESRPSASPPLEGAIVPGLHDSHVHVMLADLRQLRAGGIASVVDLGGVHHDLRAASDAGLAPTADLPRIAYAGAFLTVPGGYPSQSPWARPGSCRDVGSPAEAADAVGEQIDAGATRIKAVVSTAHDAPTFDVPILTAVAEAAHAAGVELVAHAQGPGAVDVVLASGADVLAHTPWTERLTDEMIETAAARTAWISTIDIHGYGQAVPDREVALDNLRRFVAAGGTVRYGTDFGNGQLPGGVNPREVAALVDAGLDVDGVLSSMTLGPADIPVTLLPDGLPDDPSALPQALAGARVLTA